jgi:hypothetical protein
VPFFPWVPFRDLEGGKAWYRLFGQSGKNLNIDSIYTLATRLVLMFEKLALKHS